MLNEIHQEICSAFGVKKEFLQISGSTAAAALVQPHYTGLLAQMNQIENEDQPVKLTWPFEAVLEAETITPEEFQYLAKYGIPFIDGEPILDEVQVRNCRRDFIFLYKNCSTTAPKREFTWIQGKRVVMTMPDLYTYTNEYELCGTCGASWACEHRKVRRGLLVAPEGKTWLERVGVKERRSKEEEAWMMEDVLAHAEMDALKLGMFHDSLDF